MANILIATCGDCESIELKVNNRRRPICLGETLYEQMIQSSNLCDVTLELCGVVRRAHWCVLVNYPFFEAMYRAGLKETREGIVRISEGSYEAIQAAIHFMYTGNVRLDCRLLSEVLHVADYLQISNLVQLCEQCLLTLKTPNTCVDTYLLSRQYCLTINEELVVYIINNLAEVIQYPPNGQILTLNMIQEILLHESAYDVPQEVLYQFYRKWFAYDVNSRKGDFEDLFCSQNLQDTSHSFFKSLECEYIQTLKRCRDHYHKAKREHIGNRMKHSNEIARVIIVVGEIEICVNNIVKKKRNVFACEIGSGPISRVFLVIWIGMTNTL
ncbi:kelch-like protein 32 isoform X2 [Dreissena polymorpha]|uniref:kelch-like protein 32 isoform X2 n=1 Tax=Dreissena polymorpha TaxID=45954 RepID=UPI0022654A37|nr:kelch-like protein 32 isoform X2 [Dreissena polymorpha]